MTLVNVAPKQTSRRSSLFHNDFNQFVQNFFNETNSFPIRQQPAANILEKADAFVVELAVPGLSKKDIQIDVEKNILSIKADKTREQKEGIKIRKNEFNYHSFERKYRLPKTIDIENIKAAYKNGVLILTLAKKEEAKELPPRQINIQ